MYQVRNALIFLCMLFVAPGLYAQRQELEAFPALMNLIRGEKFELILPQAMQDNDIDMWIHVVRGENPLNFELGDHSGVYIFTDRGEAGIERAVLGGQADRELYDVFGSESDLGQFVADRDPQRIALNYAEEGSGFDTISREDRTRVLEALGDEYSNRVVPAKHLIADFLAGRVMSEVALYGRLLINSTNIIESEFAKIVPGETRLSEIAGNVFVRDLDGNEENNSDYVVQPGDLVGILHGANMREFSEHNGGIGYVLRPGETGLPPEIQRIWGHALRTREIFRRNIIAGRTGAETLDVLIDEIEQAGYHYIDQDQYDTTADPEKTQVHIDFHALGRIVSQEEAPRISPTGWGRDLKIPLYHTFALEYMIHMPVPEWGTGKHLYICLHDGALVTERGVEFPARPAQEILMIR